MSESNGLVGESHKKPHLGDLRLDSCVPASAGSDESVACIYWLLQLPGQFLPSPILHVNQWVPQPSPTSLLQTQSSHLTSGSIV